MSLKLDNFPASAVFETISQSLQASDDGRKDAIAQANALFVFSLTNEKRETESWYLDLKNDGTVGKGAAPSGGKADVTLELSDEDFAGLVSGKANAQRLFMSGKLKVKGNVMKAMKIEPVLKKAQTKAKL